MSVIDYKRYIPPRISVTSAHRKLQPIGRMRRGAFVSAVGTRVVVLTSTLVRGYSNGIRGVRKW